MYHYLIETISLKSSRMKKYFFFIIAFIGVFFSYSLVFGRDAVSLELYSKKVIRHQSASCYDDYLVVVTDSVAKVQLYNLKTKKSVCIIQHKPYKDPKKGSSVYHSNNCSFGKRKYDKDDFFPLLYVSHRENSENRGVLQVFRIIPYHVSNRTEFDSISVSLVQTIFYPVANDKNALGSPWTIISEDGDKMYTYSRNNRKNAKNHGICKISEFQTPEIGDSVVYLSENDIKVSYSAKFLAFYAQGGCAHKGKLYILQGSPSKPEMFLRIVDLRKKQLLKSINLGNLGLKEEPEGCFIYDGNLMFSTNNRNTYKVNIKLD